MSRQSRRSGTSTGRWRVALAGGASLGLLLAITGCASSPPQPTPERHVTVRTAAAALPGPAYAWFEMPRTLAAEHDARVDDPQFRAHLQQALDDTLAAKGYRRVDDMAAADFLLAWRAGVRDLEQTTVSRPEESTPDTRMAAIECSRAGCSQLVMPGESGTPVLRLRTTTFVEGGLLVEAIEPATVRLLWSGFNRGTVHAGDATPEGLAEIARETLAQFPPAGGN